MKALDTTTLHNLKYRTFQPSTSEVRVMSEAASEKKLKQADHELVEGITVFQWPEFQALARRLMISLEDPIIDVTIYVPCEGLARITTVTHGLDEQSTK